MRFLCFVFVLLGSFHGYSEEVDAESPSALDEIIIPSVQFVETPLDDAVQFLQVRGQELRKSSGEKAPPINIVILGDELREKRIGFELTSIPLKTALGLAAEVSGAQLFETPGVFVIARGVIPNAVIRLKGFEKTEKKLKSIRIPNIEFQKTPLKDALAFLQQRSVELGAEGERVNVVLNNPQPVGVTLQLEDVSLYTALEMTALAAGYQMQIREHLVFFDLHR